ncbi:hypothetical protein GCM10010317_099720 [Streptomyces mirabilis]|nr:hypothetical protein GCM10010317_099720 [Streptomyces mirabilis]
MRDRLGRRSFYDPGHTPADYKLSPSRPYKIKTTTPPRRAWAPAEPLRAGEAVFGGPGNAEPSGRDRVGGTEYVEPNVRY